VTIYLGLGFVFARQITAVADIAGNFSGVLAAATVTVVLTLWLRAALRSD
jgi:hypothetical protein